MDYVRLMHIISTSFIMLLATCRPDTLNFTYLFLIDDFHIDPGSVNCIINHMECVRRAVDIK